MFRVAICDDNAADGRHIYDLTKQILRERGVCASIFLCQTPGELLRDAEIHRYDLYILDILMDETNGIELAQILRAQGNQAMLIYTTISRDYAIDGYKVQANDYLVKPVDENALRASIDRILSRGKTILIKADGQMITILTSDIQFAEASGHYILLKRADGSESVCLRSTLSEVQKKLGEKQFTRCHKGYLVNLGHVKEIRTSQILLRSGSTLPLGRQYRQELQRDMVRYVERVVPI